MNDYSEEGQFLFRKRLQSGYITQEEISDYKPPTGYTVRAQIKGKNLLMGEVERFVFLDPESAKKCHDRLVGKYIGNIKNEKYSKIYVETINDPRN